MENHSRNDTGQGSNDSQESSWEFAAGHARINDQLQLHFHKKGAPIGAPLEKSAAAAVVIAATVVIVAAAVAHAAAIVTTATEQDEQNDDPAAVTAKETIVTHNTYLQKFFHG